MGPTAHGMTNHISQRCRGHDRCCFAGADNGAGDGAGKAFLAIEVDDIGELFFGQGIDGIGGTFAICAHAHVERSIGLERKTAGRIGQLKG